LNLWCKSHQIDSELLIGDLFKIEHLRPILVKQKFMNIMNRKPKINQNIHSKAFEERKNNFINRIWNMEKFGGSLIQPKIKLMENPIK
jgi:hypothetical protein